MLEHLVLFKWQQIFALKIEEQNIACCLRDTDTPKSTLRPPQWTPRMPPRQSAPARVSLIGGEERAFKKRTFFRARYAQVTCTDVCTAYPNIAKSTQHYKLFVKIPNLTSLCYVFLRIITPKNYEAFMGVTISKRAYSAPYK